MPSRATPKTKVAHSSRTPRLPAHLISASPPRRRAKRTCGRTWRILRTQRQLACPQHPDFRPLYIPGAACIRLVHMPATTVSMRTRRESPLGTNLASRFNPNLYTATALRRMQHMRPLAPFLRQPPQDSPLSRAEQTSSQLPVSADGARTLPVPPGYATSAKPHLPGCCVKTPPNLQSRQAVRQMKHLRRPRTASVAF